MRANSSGSGTGTPNDLIRLFYDVGQKLKLVFRCEMLFPLFSVLKESSFKAREMHMLLLHLRRKHLMEWVRNVIATTLRVSNGGSLPSIWLQEDADDSHGQLIAPLQGVSSNTWVRALSSSGHGETCGCL